MRDGMLYARWNSKEKLFPTKDEPSYTGLVDDASIMHVCTLMLLGIPGHTDAR